jgi:hypothetical protein
MADAQKRSEATRDIPRHQQDTAARKLALAQAGPGATPEAAPPLPGKSIGPDEIPGKPIVSADARPTPDQPLADLAARSEAGEFAEGEKEAAKNLENADRGAPDEPVEDLDTLTVPELKELAAKEETDLTGAHAKADIIGRIKRHRRKKS